MCGAYLKRPKYAGQVSDNEEEVSSDESEESNEEQRKSARAQRQPNLEAVKADAG